MIEDGRELPVAWRSPLLPLAEATNFSVAAMRVVVPDDAPGHDRPAKAQEKLSLVRPLSARLQPLGSTEILGLELVYLRVR